MTANNPRCRGLLGVLAILALQVPARAYVEAPHSFGQLLNLSTNIVVMQVEKVDREKNLIIYRKVRDLKGKHSQEVIKHNIARAGFNAREWQIPMQWAEAGKIAVFFHNGGASETYIHNWWYQAYAGGEWWNHSHGEPFLLRSYAGKPEKLITLITEALAGKEVIVPCMVDGNKEDLHHRRARIQRLRASLKLNDYNAKRDFVGWGDEDFRRLQGFAGFTHISGLPAVGPEAQAISTLDINGDGKMDVCLVGASRIAVLQNDGESLNEISLPGASGARAAVWADYNGDGRPDLLLATPTGPKLFTNFKDGFRDDSHLLPRLPAYNLTAAAWIDQDGDGRPDILLGNGFHGLRLFRNAGKVERQEPLVLGPWHYCGPFENAGNRGFATAYPPEMAVDLKQTHKGKRGEPCPWKEAKFIDGQVNDLAHLFKPEHRNEAAVYLYRQIEVAADMDCPISLGSDDTLTVWLNGKKILEQNTTRGAAPDQARLTLKLKKGKNDFLMKICQGGGDWAFYFRLTKELPPPVQWAFEDVSEAVGLGDRGIGSDCKGDSLTVADVDGDGKMDFLYGAGQGMLVRNTGKKFEVVASSGINYRPGKVGPVFADLDGDGHPDLLVPQADGVKLFRNDGKGKFTDVTAKSGDLGQRLGRVTSVCWGDFDNDGFNDLFVGRMKASNLYFRNRGDGTFVDASASIGLDQRIWNTQAVCLADLNGDGMLDVVFNNEGQESLVLLGNPDLARKRTPVTVQVAGNLGVTGAKVRVLCSEGKLRASHVISGGDGRGGQTSPLARFALEPGKYRVEVVFSSGERRIREIQVAQGRPMRDVIDDKTPRAN